MKRIICILLMLLFAVPAFAQENPFAPYEITTPEGVTLEAGEGSHAFVMGKTRVVVMVIPRVPDEDPERALQRMVFQFDPDAVLGEALPMVEGYVGVHALSEGKLGEGVDTLHIMILSEAGDLLILSGYDLDGDEEKVHSLLETLLSQLSVNGNLIVAQE